MRRIFVLILLMMVFCGIRAQNSPEKKYNSLLWEITGNGLKKPSYLFGTMHVSSKLAFHLSDSFYYAIKSVDKIAIELNPESWQPEMARQILMGNEWSAYNRTYYGAYINEYSFRIDKYEERLKRAFSAEPGSINMLLYRTYESAQDYEEDTFLDMYIYQTGKRLGKQATGVEDFWEMEKLVAEAYDDMRKDKKPKKQSYSEDMYDAPKKLQEAYKKGDLDQLDSLNKIMQGSDVFLEKFLYRRNENQANAIDSILKHNTLFCGVGSAHLPGKRGVIELLRKKGYKLRPVFMKNRDAEQKDALEKIKVPVVFQTYTSSDGFFKVSVPGKLYNYPSQSTPGILQYADMANGVYYTINRLQTQAAIIGQSEQMVLKKVDSLLYENIPGKIILRKNITKNGYPGLDVTNRTRHGDIQRHQIIITPFDIFIFKMSGTGDYVSNNPEVETFFNSIELKDISNPVPETFKPSSGGFTAQFPHTPYQVKDEGAADQIDTWYYEAYDRKSENAYMIVKKSVQQFDFMEQDSFDISLADESFMLGDFFERNISRKYSSFKGYPCLDVRHKLKDSSEVSLRYIYKGPHYYMLAQKGKSEADAKKFFDSFSFTPYNYGPTRNFVDTFYKYSVQTPVYRNINDTIRKLTASGDYNYYNSDDLYRHVDYQSAAFSNDQSGEMAGMGIQTYNDYFYAKDTDRFWKEETGESYRIEKFILQKKEAFNRGDSIRGYQFWYRDTASSKMIRRMAFLYKNRMYRASFITDTLEQDNEFMRSFFSTLHPYGYNDSVSVFTDKADVFFRDFYSNDTARKKKALSAVLYVDFARKDIPSLMDASRSVNVSEKDYLVNKVSFIKAIAYMGDSTAEGDKLKALQLLYKDAGDTSSLQNEILMLMAAQKTKESFAVVKQIIMQDPPVFDNDYDFEELFRNFSDTLLLARSLFPDLLQLASIDSYKSTVVSLLAELVDSGFVKSKDYDSYYSKFMFDMKFLMKKLKAADEKIAGNEVKKKDDAEDDEYRSTDDLTVESGTKVDLYNYSVLLMPYYDKNEAVRNIFNKLLLTKDDAVRAQTAGIMLRNNKAIPDSIINSLAAKDQYRVKVYTELEGIGKLNLFPVKYKTQVDMARALIYDQAQNSTDIDSLIFISKQQVQFFEDTGVVYFFKYKRKNQDDWFVALSGLQPLQPDSVNIKDDYVVTGASKISAEEPIEKTLQKELKEKMFSRRKSSQDFFNNRYEDYGYLKSLRR